jgi:6,7-dimethyl-8-ribityllumazine synthase
MSDLREHTQLPADAAAGFRFAVVVSRFNEAITEALRDGAVRTLERHGATAASVQVHAVPGAFELPMTAARLVDGRVDAVICLGALIKGETPHFEYLSASVAQGLQEVAVRSGVPVIFGVLTCETLQHAEARAGGDKGNKGAEAALAAIEMANLFAGIAPGREGTHGQTTQSS